MSKEVVSFCRGCVSSCGLIFEVDGEKIVSHHGDTDSPVSSGYKCIKGDMSVEFMQDQTGRLTQCLRRDEAGTLVPVGADALMDAVARQMARNIEDHG